MSKKIARDLNPVNMEERIYQTENETENIKNDINELTEKLPVANPTGEATDTLEKITIDGVTYSVAGEDERLDNYLEKNFSQSSSDVPIGCTFIDDEQQIKSVYTERKNQSTGDVELSIVDQKNLQMPVNSGRLQLYIDGYFDDLTDATHKVTPIYDTINYVVDYDLTKIPDIDKFAEVGVKYTDDVYHNDLDRTIEKCFVMVPQVWSINTPENMIGLGADLQNFNIRLYVDGFEQKIAFSNNDFKIRLKLSKTVVENNAIISREGFFLSEIRDALQCNSFSKFISVGNFVPVYNTKKITGTVFTDVNTVDTQTIYETYLILDDIKISENDFTTTYIDVYCKSNFYKYLEINE